MILRTRSFCFFVDSINVSFVYLKKRTQFFYDHLHVTHHRNGILQYWYVKIEIFLYMKTTQLK